MRYLLEIAIGIFVAAGIILLATSLGYVIGWTISEIDPNSLLLAKAGILLFAGMVFVGVGGIINLFRHDVS